MNPSNARNAIQQYGQLGPKLDANDVSAHRIIQMLMEGALDKIAIAKGHMERKEIKEKGNFISWAISIIEGLRASLDSESGGEIATNLEDLYDYMQRRLVEANATNEVAVLDEVAGLLKNIKTAWDDLPQEVTAAKSPVASE